MSSRLTRENVADAAESLFGDHGFAGTSLRQITVKAGVNLAAINYHYRSKEDLYRQVLLRRLRPINAERLSLLAQAEQLAGDQPVPLRAIVDAWVRPWLRAAGNATSDGLRPARLLSRELIDPQPFLRDELGREFAPLLAHYARALGLSLPGVPATELSWRLQFMLGTLLAAAMQWESRAGSGAVARADSGDPVLRLVGFCAAGLESPRPAP